MVSDTLRSFWNLSGTFKLLRTDRLDSVHDYLRVPRSAPCPGLSKSRIGHLWRVQSYVPPGLPSSASVNVRAMIDTLNQHQ